MDRELEKYVKQHEEFIEAIHAVIFADVKKNLILPVVKKLHELECKISILESKPEEIKKISLFLSTLRSELEAFRDE